MITCGTMTEVVKMLEAKHVQTVVYTHEKSRRRERAQNTNQLRASMHHVHGHLYKAGSKSFPEGYNVSYVPPTCDITYLYHAKGCSDLGHVTRREI